MIATLAEAAADEGRVLGAEVKVIDVTSLRVAPCTGCMSCRKTGRCVLPADDSLTVVTALREADAFIIATPSYWANLPGTLKLLFDRMVYAIIDTSGSRPRPLLRGKRWGAIVTCSTPPLIDVISHQSSGAVRALRHIFAFSGARPTRVFVRPGTRKHPAPTPRDLASARALARRLVRR